MDWRINIRLAKYMSLLPSVPALIIQDCMGIGEIYMDRMIQCNAYRFL